MRFERSNGLDTALYKNYLFLTTNLYKNGSQKCRLPFHFARAIVTLFGVNPCDVANFVTSAYTCCVRGYVLQIM